MKKKFTKAIAKYIAENQFNLTLDCILGISDPDYNLETDIEEFEQNFTEHLEEMDVIATPSRIKVINSYYEKRIAHAQYVINKLYINTEKPQ